MSFHRSWPGRALAVGSLVAGITSIPATVIAADALRHPEGTLKLAERQLVAGSTVPIRGEQFADHGKLELLLVGVAGRFRLGDVTADSVGGFAKSFDIPADIELGTYRLVAIATDDDEVASLNVEVLAACWSFGKTWTTPNCDATNTRSVSSPAWVSKSGRRNVKFSNARTDSTGIGDVSSSAAIVALAITRSVIKAESDL